MNVGDHLISPRLGYTHHGIYVGNDEVIHYSGFSSGISKGEISLTSVEEFSQGNNVKVKSYLIRTYDFNESVGRAYSRLGEDWYNVLLNNCEHFVTWCIVGFHSSSQVNNLIVNTVAARSLFTSTANREIQRQTTQAAINIVGNSAARIISNEAITKTATSVALKSMVSSSAGTFVGITSGVGLSSTGVATALTVGITTTAAAPVITTVAVAVAVGCGVKGLIDWIWD